jgi:hypothetical protein
VPKKQLGSFFMKNETEVKLPATGKTQLVGQQQVGQQSLFFSPVRQDFRTLSEGRL